MIKKMIIRDDVEYVVNFVRLILIEEEIEKMIKEFGVIIEFVNKLFDFDIKDVELIVYVFNFYNVFRSDEVKFLYLCEKIL